MRCCTRTREQSGLASRFALLIVSGVSLSCGGGPRPAAPAPAQIAFRPATSQLNRSGPVAYDDRASLLPPGWKAGNNLDQFYRLDADTVLFHGGSSAGKVYSRTTDARGFGTLAQVIKASAYRGKRVRLRAWVRVKDAPLGTLLRMSVQAPDRVLDEAVSFRLAGTTDWLQQALVLDVPLRASSIWIGLALEGPGEAWLDDVALEVVGKDVAATGLPRGYPRQAIRPGARKAARAWWGELPDNLVNPGLELQRPNPQP